MEPADIAVVVVYLLFVMVVGIWVRPESGSNHFLNTLNISGDVCIISQVINNL